MDKFYITHHDLDNLHTLYPKATKMEVTLNAAIGLYNKDGDLMVYLSNRGTDNYLHELSEPYFDWVDENVLVYLDYKGMFIPLVKGEIIL